MQSSTHMKTPNTFVNVKNTEDYYLSVHRYISEAWKKITPFWPLKNFIASNPLQGLEDYSFEQAIVTGESYFQHLSLPFQMEDVNRETIKWCQAFFDEGQATINMPFRDQGLYQAWRQLAQFDARLKGLKAKERLWLKNLPLLAEQTIAECLAKLNMPLEECSLFLTLLLTTLPGWASYIKYRTEWARAREDYYNPVKQADYLAIRLVLVCLLWPNAVELIFLYKNSSKSIALEKIKKIFEAEKKYHSELLTALSQQKIQSKSKNHLPLAQFVFCIDVRSESIRRAVESQGNYETFGCAGFFGVPVQIKNELTGTDYASCPVLIDPKHIVEENVACSKHKKKEIFSGINKLKNISRLYQALKYTFTTPFALVEILGPWNGLWMLIRTITPRLSIRLKQKMLKFFYPAISVEPNLVTENEKSGIQLNHQYVYAESALRIMGFTDNFSQVIVLCGHGGETQNNAYGSALDCGACGGHHGAANARILADILNNIDVRKYLAGQNIVIPSETIFVAALHNTTTDEITLYLNERENKLRHISNIKHDLEKAQQLNCEWRSQKMDKPKKNHLSYIKNRSCDWAQTRPEWGLARNASFIIGPRHKIKEINFDSRAFLHSYDWQQDQDGSLLTVILTAPMVVAQWINSQYLFSTIDNVAYGSGSKTTHNITGKVGVMQGNGSDLMHGLPLQSISISDTQTYHELLRLMTIIYAPRFFISNIISRHEILRKLFGNGWVFLACVEPKENIIYRLSRDFTWSKA